MFLLHAANNLCAVPYAVLVKQTLADQSGTLDNKHTLAVPEATHVRMGVDSKLITIHSTAQGRTVLASNVYYQLKCMLGIGTFHLRVVPRGKSLLAAVV